MDELLEFIYKQKEYKRDTVEAMKPYCDIESFEELLKQALNSGLLEVIEGRVLFTAKGKEKAELLIRRHRLAEALLLNVLSLSSSDVEKNACVFEHILSPEVTERICILLGHPRFCPDGKYIPEGECCKRKDTEIKPLVLSLDKLRPGENGIIRYIVSDEHANMTKLASMGFIPGRKIKLLHSYPSLVVAIDNTEIALDNSIAEEIFVLPV